MVDVGIGTYRAGSKVIIYQPAKTAMQSGKAKSGTWVVEFQEKYNRSTEPLMGWTSSKDTLTQLRLCFSSMEDAIAFAKREELRYTVVTPNKPKLIKKSYADNFK